MTFRMIVAARDRWYAGDECHVNDFIAGLLRIGKLRDAQIDAIKTYLYLKIAGRNKPLYQLYTEGLFNAPLDIENLALSHTLYERMKAEPGMVALYQYLHDDEIGGTDMLEAMQREAEHIDPQGFFREMMGGVTYTDYVFSLPMGAGKTFLMAAFIYIDLYFGRDDAAFASNFIVFAPSGTKSSVVPSLRTIQDFDPAWLFEGPVASQLRAELTFEVLDAAKTGSQSNKTRNPNAQKVARHQPFATLRGLVLVTNAEKVILDNVRPDASGLVSFDGLDDDPRAKAENELRTLLGRLPRLSILIDEVHHASDNDIKLRAVVNTWVRQGSDVVTVLGFSGTPYEKTKRKVAVTAELSVKQGILPHVVYFYPLVDGIGNFLKKPTVQRIDGTSEEIITAGLREFFKRYRDTVYPDGTCAKVAVYCGSVARLEEQVAPVAARIASELGMDPSEVILKYHRGGTGRQRYAVPANAAAAFATLDTPESRKRIILLVQIAKEGWDCRSLTGVILSQKGDCSQTMVLQTSCRCLRQVTKGVGDETAYIALNDSNASKLATQLRETQRADLDTFQTGSGGILVARRSRMGTLTVPPIDAYQFALSSAYTIDEGENRPISTGLAAAADDARIGTYAATYEHLDLDHASRYEQADVSNADPTPISFSRWLQLIRKEGGGRDRRLDAMLADPCNRDALAQLFLTVTNAGESSDLSGASDAARTSVPQLDITAATFANRYADPHYDQVLVRANVRKLAYPKRDVVINLETIDEIRHLSVMIDERAIRPVLDVPRSQFIPDAETERQMLERDANGRDLKTLDAKNEQAYRALLELGLTEQAEQLKMAAQANRHGEEMRTWQYVPYHFDSPFERKFHELLMASKTLERLGIEVYYNGDTTMADFRIRCFRKAGKQWRSVGLYTPDFLLVKREPDERGGTHVAHTLIIETKGRGFAADQGFADRRAFMEQVFVPENNRRLGHEAFSYVVVSDGDAERQLLERTEHIARRFFSSPAA